MEKFVSRRAFHFWTSKVAEEAEMGARDMGSTPAVAGPRPREVRLGVLQAGRSGERGARRRRYATADTVPPARERFHGHRAPRGR